MKASELSANNLTPGAYLAEGEDSYWQGKVVEVFQSLVPSEYREFNLFMVDKPLSLEPIRDALETISFFPSSKVVVVKGGTLKLEPKNKELDTLIKGIAEDTYLLLTDAAYLTPTDKKKFTVIACEKSDIFETRDVIYSLVPRDRIEPKAVEMLMEYTNRDLQRITGEISKLIAYADGRKITVDDVDALVVNTIENSVFDFSEAISKGNSAKAMLILDRFVARGVSYAFLLATLMGQYRRMLHGVLSKESDAELAEKMGIKEYAVKKARETTGYGKRLRPAYLKKCMDTLVEAELNFKSGVQSEENAFRTAVVKLMEAR